MAGDEVDTSIVALRETLSIFKTFFTTFFKGISTVDKSSKLIYILPI